MIYITYLGSSGSRLGRRILLLEVANDTFLWRSRVSTRFNSQLPACPESVAAVLKVLSQNDNLMVKDIARRCLAWFAKVIAPKVES
jgi:hypothetical protein